jgi:hypothetical protein
MTVHLVTSGFYIINIHLFTSLLSRHLFISLCVFPTIILFRSRVSCFSLCACSFPTSLLVPHFSSSTHLHVLLLYFPRMSRCVERTVSSPSISTSLLRGWVHLHHDFFSTTSPFLSTLLCSDLLLPTSIHMSPTRSYSSQCLSFRLQLHGGFLSYSLSLRVSL